VSDPWVQNVQQWLNDTYTGVTGWDPVDVDGFTGWETMYALTKALQHELGITALSNTFGPATLSALSALGPIGPSTTHQHIANINRILVGGLYCKGYNGGNGQLTGVYSDITVTAVRLLREDVGIPPADGTMPAKLFKGLLTMDAYRLLPGGSPALRDAQKWLNDTYDHRSAFYYIPTDGLGSRNVLKALIYAVQYEGGMSDSVANGNFGPATQTSLQTNGLLTTATVGKENYKRIFHAAMLMNGQEVAFSSTFTAEFAEQVTEFQEFVQLVTNGEGDFRTWSSLLQSKGDPERPALGCDTATPLTAVSAAAIYAAGYRIVGRYLVTAGSDPTKKRLQPGELQTILAAGLRVFPIFQMTGDTLDYFSEARGLVDGQAAAAAAASFFFLSGTTIYFAVDYDAQDAEVTSRILPYFKGVIRGLRVASGPVYQVGVYGTRNVCIRVSEEFGLVHSFVSDMSTGYSGNMGFPLPANWAFDQIHTISVPYNGGSVSIDRDVWFRSDSPQHTGGADMGVDTIYGTSDVNGPFIQWIAFLENRAVQYHADHPSSANPRVLAIQYARVAHNNYQGVIWDQVAGGLDSGWISYVEGQIADAGITPVLNVVDPWSGASITFDHMAYTMQALFAHGMPVKPAPNRGDIAGWGGDLITILHDYLSDNRGYVNSEAYGAALIGSSMLHSSFSQDDLLADVDGFNLAFAMIDDPDLDLLTVIAGAYQSGGSGPVRTSHRFTEFYNGRFGSAAEVDASGMQLFRGSGDPIIEAVRTGLLAPHVLGNISDATIEDVVNGFKDVIDRRRAIE